MMSPAGLTRGPMTVSPLRLAVGARVKPAPDSIFWFYAASYGAAQPMIGTELMLFLGLPSMTRSLYET
jgi:hypothetical protein